MFGKTVKNIVALLFIPIVIGSTRAFFQNIGNLGLFNANLYLLISGFFAYPVFHIVFFKPMYIYALGHEMVHVAATWLCGGKVLSFNVSDKGGSVTSSKNNLFITLSPYFVPIHAIVLFIAFWVARQFIDMSGFAREFVFLVGFTISFHIFMTIEVMKIEQPDLLRAGYLFSVFFIYVANVFVATLVLDIIFRDIAFIDFVKNTFVLSKSIYINIYNAIMQ